jgi:hypothetical protein
MSEKKHSDVKKCSYSATVRSNVKKKIFATLSLF